MPGGWSPSNGSVLPREAGTIGAVLLMLSVRGSRRETSPAASLVGRLAAVLVMLQVAAGVLNLFLSLIWLQLVHLFLVDLEWLCAVLLTACAAAETAPAVSGSQSPALDTAAAHR